MEELAVLDESSSKYYYWHQADDLLGEELMMSSSELLEETPPPPPPTDSKQAEDEEEDEGPRRRRESMVNKLISTVYSGPTISDIESALSFTGGGDHHQHKYSSTSPVVFSPEKVLSKMENKYTLKIKTCGNNGLAEDGYKWRKYGQKSIKNSPNPRSYYRCTNPRCNAKKQVERATDEPDTLLVTYEGLHLHYTYSHFFHAAQDHQQQGLPKKPKKGPFLDMGGPTTQQQPTLELDGPAHPLEDLDRGKSSCEQDAASWYLDHGRDDHQQQHTGNGGLLEDVVPLRVRRPCNGSSGETTTASNNNSSSSPPSPSTSVSCWTPTSPPYIDMAILSNIFF